MKLLKILLAAIVMLVICLTGAAVWNEYDIESMGNPPPYTADMTILRTPDDRFALEDFPYEPHYLDISDDDLGTLRVHYLDEGPRDGHVIVLLHGQATWSYSFRKFIPVLTEAGYRVIAPDFVGFGRSDKPADWEDHSFEKHVVWLRKTLQGLNMEGATAFMFDWGGYFGLRVAVDYPDMFSRLVLCTTGMPRANGLIGPLWIAWWRRHVLKPPVFPISDMVEGMTGTEMDALTVKGLDAPYPDESYKAGPRRFPMMIPATFLHPSTKPNRAAWEQLRNWDKPTVTYVSELLAKRGFNPKELHDQIPGTANQPHATFPETNFFLIEDVPEELAQKTVEFIQQSGG